MDPQMATAFHLIPYGIYVLITRRGPEPCAMIVSWASQVSYAPPLLMVALRRTRFALPAIQESGVFSLSLLRREQKLWVARFKNPISQQQFVELFFETNKKNPPVLRDALASWQCRVSSTLEPGDHILVIGEVCSTLTGREGKPLTTPDYGKTYIGQY
jgi:flavin reductase (DIM6/NTAB) family NADH-FMN oxidoreductase RutF